MKGIRNYFVHPRAEIDEGVEIGEFSVIGPDVRIGRGTKISSCVRIEGNVVIGSDNTIHHGAVIGAPPQDTNWEGEPSFVEIGDNNILREYVTIHRATGEGNITRIGNNNFIMAYSHIAHNVSLGSECTIANGTQIAGYVTVEDCAFISGLVVIHQFVRIGRYSMTGGLSRINQDIPPFMMAVGIPLVVIGINLLGLKRRGFSKDRIRTIKEAFKVLYRSGLNTKEALSILKKRYQDNEDVGYLVRFIETSKRGITKRTGIRSLSDAEG